MTPSALVGMRIAAALCHVLPSVRIRIRHRDEVILEAAHHPGQPAPSDRAIGACAFRRAVAVAHEQAKQGIALSFMGLPERAELRIETGVPTGDAILPGGIYRVAMGEQTVHGFATTLPPRRCREVLEALPDNGHVVRIRHDAATEVTFVHTVTPTERAPLRAYHLERALEAVLAAEVVHELATVAP